MFCDFLRSILVSTPDFGDEYCITVIPPVPVKLVFPWLTPPAPQMMGFDDEVEAIDEDTYSDQVHVSPNNRIPAPGVLHIIDNVANNLVESSPSLDECVTGLDKVGTLLRSPASRVRLLVRCFSSVVGRVQQAAVNRYNAKVHRQRWGTVAFA